MPNTMLNTQCSLPFSLSLREAGRVEEGAPPPPGIPPHHDPLYSSAESPRQERVLQPGAFSGETPSLRAAGTDGEGQASGTAG